MDRPKPGTDEVGYIWLQDEEEDGRAECGCHLIASQEDSGPAIHLCPMHSAAPNMLRVLGVLQKRITTDKRFSIQQDFSIYNELACAIKEARI